MFFRRLLFSHNSLVLLAMVLGIASGALDHHDINGLADIISDVTIRLMKLISLPLLFLSVVASASHFKSFDHMKSLGTKIVKYTLLTTVIATLVAEVLYLVISPYLLRGDENIIKSGYGAQAGFFDTLLSMIPDNLVSAFVENNVMAVVVIAVIMAMALLGVKEKEREAVFNFFSGLLNAVMRIVSFGLRFIPIAVWAFVAILTRQIFNDEAQSLNAIGGLTLTVILANLVQGIIVLPILLRLKGIDPLKLFLKVKDALIVAFFTRSSMAALPVSLKHAINDAKISPDVARLSLPLCTTINMNGCAQFILISVYFVSAFSGNPLTPWEHVGMIALSVIAAVGNAGVPMGCFFLASSILASKNIPLHLMGSILPLYAFIDMVETALNVWSDISVAKMVDEELVTEASPSPEPIPDTAAMAE